MSGKPSIIRKQEDIPLVYALQPVQSPITIKRFWYQRLWDLVTPNKKEINIDAPEGVELVVNS